VARIGKGELELYGFNSERGSEVCWVRCSTPSSLRWEARSCPSRHHLPPLKEASAFDLQELFGLSPTLRLVGIRLFVVGAVRAGMLAMCCG